MGMQQTPQKPAYAILRVEKHKTPGTLGGALQHALRERETPNADPERLALNLNGGATSSAAGIARMRELFDALECKPRHKSGKNAPVLAIEYFVGMSPDAAIAGDRKRALAYLNDALTWIAKRHGLRNVMAAQFHFDESTPHASVFVFPERDGRLNAKSFTGGRELLAKMQTDFAATVGSKHGLVRGEERSKATHVDIADWYAAVEERDQLRTEVKGLRTEVAQLRTEVTRLTDVLDTLAPALKEATEEKAARALADRQATSRPATGSERATARSTGPQDPSNLTPGRRRP
jgi:Plasmid recombination enzyme